MAILITRDFETGVSYTTGAEGTDQFYSEPQVGIDEFGDPVLEHIEIYNLDGRTGSQSLKFTIEKGIYRDTYPLCRSEVRTQVFGGNPGVMQGWIAFSFKALTVTTGLETAVIAQLWDGGSPSMSIRWRFSDNSVFLRIYDNSSSTDYQICNVGDGAWHDIVMWYQARENSTGKVKVWHNLELWSTGELTRQNIYTPETDATTPYWKFGLYASGFGEGDLDNRIALFDQVNHADDSGTDVETFELLDPEGRQALSGITYATYEGPDYYVSNSGSDSNDGSSGSPFATVNKALQEIAPGGTIYGNRGDEFYEELNLLIAGTTIDPIVFDAYGTGALPKLTGFRTLNSWTDIGGGLFRCTDAEITERVNVLIVDNAVQPLGRLPKTSYYASTARTGNSSGTITDTVNLSSDPNYAGGEIVIRKNAWVLDRGNITAHSGSTLTYSGTSVYNSQVWYGYFIQNKRSLCTELHEWCQEGSDIIMYFGAASPATYTIKAAVLPNVVKTTVNRGNHTWQNWRFEGYNGDLDDTDNNNGSIFNIQACPNMKWHNCEFRYFGNTGWQWYSCPGLQIQNCTIEDFMNIGIWQRFEDGSTGISITGNTVRRIGTIPGAGGNSDNGYLFFKAIPETLELVVENNNVQYVGYHGLSIGGYDFLIRDNFLQYCCYLMDDGGCIYHFKGSRDHVYDRLQRIIEYNICLDSPGNNDGKPSGTLAGEGIYIDDNASTVTGDEITIRFNTCSGNKLGLKLHNCRDMTVTDNLFFDNLQQVEFSSDTITNTFIRNIEFKRNVMYSVTATHETLAMQCKDNSPQLYGDFNDNYYMRPSNENDLILVNFKGSPISTETYSLAEWKANGMDHDENSKGSPTTSELVMFLYNETLTPEVVNLDNIYMDINGVLVDSGEITIPAFESELLLDDFGPVEEPTGNTKPTATIVSPATDLTFYTDTPIEFETFADDPDAGDSVVQLDLYYGPNAIELRSTPPQGQNFFTWANPVAGEWLIMLISTDSNGAMKSDTINMSVLVPNETPNAVISSDVDSGNAPLEVSFIGDQSTDDVGIVSYLWDFGDTNTSTLANPIHTFAAGNYNVSLTVEDGGGLTDTAFHLITVTEPNTLPTISITSPPAGSVYTEGATVRIVVDASDVDENMTFVDFRANDQSIGESHNAPFTFDWENVAPGEYSVIARAFDTQGFTDSSPITITVNEASPTPTVITVRGLFRVI